jgi:hypothetical protein
MYPNQPGYPTQPPAQPGYPTQPPAQPGYPTQPPAQPGYPTQPPAQPGYPTQPPAQPGYPSQPPAQLGYPSQYGQPFAGGGGSIFDGMGSEDPSQTGNYLPLTVATYVAEIERVFFNQGRQSNSVIVDFKIVWSGNPAVQAGTSWNWYQSCSWEGWKGRLKGFIGACNGIDPYDKDALRQAFPNEQSAVAAAELAISPANPLMGKLVRLDTAPAGTKKGGQVTAHKWRPYRPEEFSGGQ